MQSTEQAVDSEVLTQFVSITGAEESIARDILSACNSDLANSLSHYFAIQDAGGTIAGPSGGDESRGAASAQTEHRNDAMDTGVAAPTSTAAPFAHDTTESDAAFAAALAREEQPFSGENVRAPIAERMDTLVQEGRSAREDGHLLRAGERAAFLGVDTPSTALYDRDFGSGAASAARTVEDASSLPRGSTFGASSSLAGLYRPPNRILIYGSLEKALETGARNNKWILVNIQAHNEFSSIVLNRDVWGDEAVQALVGSAFYLWQRYLATADGERYKTYYAFDNLPHVALLDPRTGERLLVWESSGDPSWHLTPERLLSDLTDFLDNHSLEQDALGPTHMRKTRALEEFAFGAIETASAPGAADGDFVPTDGDISMMDEDAQMAAAIAASMGEHTGHGINSQHTESADGAADENMYSRSPEFQRMLSSAVSRENAELNAQRHIIREQDEEYQMALAIDRSRAEMQRQEQLEAERAALETQRTLEERDARREKIARRVPAEPQAEAAQITELAIRLPSGKRLIRRFRLNHTIQSVLDYVVTEAELSEGAFDLLSTYPRKVFTSTPDMTLESAGLFPKAALIVTER